MAKPTSSPNSIISCKKTDLLWHMMTQKLMPHPMEALQNPKKSDNGEWVSELINSAVFAILPSRIENESHRQNGKLLPVFLAVAAKLSMIVKFFKVARLF